MRFMSLFVRKKPLILVSIATLATTAVLFWSTTSKRRSRVVYYSPRKISATSRSRTFSLFVDDVIFDQPWSLANITVIDDINFFLNGTNRRYIISDFTYSPGLGNLMFQYASLRAIAEIYGAQLILPESCKLRRAFSLDAVFASDEITEKLLKMFSHSKMDFEICCRYYPNAANDLFVSQQQNIEFLAGYFQSFRYFHPHHEVLIRREFQFLPGILKEAQSLLQKARLEQTLTEPAVMVEGDINDQVVLLDGNDDAAVTYIGIHVRKGTDITMNAKNLAHGHTSATEEYFTHAMDYYRKKYGKVLFIVATDNLQWVRKYMKPKAKGEIYILTTHKREIDLATLSLCNHTVLSTGTFSWWAGYLTNGETIYYSGWPLKNSVLDIMVEKSDLFLPNWIVME